MCLHILGEKLPLNTVMSDDNKDNNTNINPDNTDNNTLNTTYVKNKLNAFYKLAHSTKSSINSSFYAVTGIKLDQKKLVVSFIFTLLKDFALAYTARASIKLIPKLIKMLQSFKYNVISLS